MKLVETLLNTAVADLDLLEKNRTIGDNPLIRRNLEFCLYAKDEERAQLICDFVMDNHYGMPSYEQSTYNEVTSWRILIVIHTATTEHVVCTLSGFMACLAALYDLEYDGWGSVICGRTLPDTQSDVL